MLQEIKRSRRRRWNI